MITHVAIRYRGKLYALPEPWRHHHLLPVIAWDTGEPVDESYEQGFLADGQFLDRTAALAHALACRQVKAPAQIRAGKLFSEDVW